jgi:hypothetical protein
MIASLQIRGRPLVRPTDVMAEFKFSCPHCSQHIQCDTGYAGTQINCPACKQAIVVPQAPPSAAASPAAIAPPPPAPVAPPPLATRQNTAVPAPGRRFAGAPGAPKPPQKPRALKAILSVTAAVVGAAIGFFAVQLVIGHSAKQKAAQGNPAAQVPTPSAAAATGALGVLEKVHQAYTNLASLNVSGTSMTVVDMSAVTMADVNPKAKKNTKRRPANIPKGITNSTDVAILLARPDLYRIEGTSKTEAGRRTVTNTIAIWSAGKGDYALMGKNYMKLRDRSSGFAMTGSSGGLAMAIPQLFFDDTAMMGKIIQDWGQTEDESLDGRDCYTLTAKMFGQKLKIWVSKSSYMILQSQITLGAPVSDVDIDAALSTFNTNTNMTPAQMEQMKAQARQQAAMMTKIRGTVTETYDRVETNQTYAAADFNYPVPPGAKLMPSPF